MMHNMGGTKVAFMKYLYMNSILVLTILGVILGICLGSGLWQSRPNDMWKTVIGFPGEILLNLFKMIVLPLITVTLICGVARMDRQQLGYIGGCAMGLFLLTTVVAVALGILLVIVVHPGKPGTRLGSAPFKTGVDIQPETIDTFLDLMRNAFPDNLFEATIRVGKTTIVSKNETDVLTNQTTLVQKRKLTKEFGSNILGLVVFSLSFGAILSIMGAEARPLVKVLNVADTAITKIVMLVIWYSPFGIVFIVARKILDIEDPAKVLEVLGWYLVVSIGAQLLVFILQNMLYALLTLRNPFKLVFSQFKAIFMALGTSSSIATLPVNMECIERNMGVHKAISQVVLPVGATINMNGTAVHIAISSIFIAQINNASLTVVDYLVVWITASLAAIGAAGIPSASIFTMVVVLSAIGQPVADISVIFPVDWILDRLRTINNTYGDAVIACVLNRYFGKKIRAISEKANRSEGEPTQGSDSIASERVNSRTRPSASPIPAGHKRTMSNENDSPRVKKT